MHPHPIPLPSRERGNWSSQFFFPPSFYGQHYQKVVNSELKTNSGQIGISFINCYCSKWIGERYEMLHRLKKKQLQNLISDSVSASTNKGREVCGLIVDTGYFLELIQVKNKIKRGGSFAFYVDEVNKIESAASILSYKIVGTFHSHPYYFAKPGESDLAAAEDGELMLIIDCLDKEAMLWKVKNKSAKKVKFELI